MRPEAATTRANEGYAEAKARHTQSDTDEVDTTRPGTDEEKATHLSELMRPDIFIMDIDKPEGYS
ncbi:hypothetical protein TRIUR3_14836 [Triticum urartu]|uniref:Uncharacterized protein n=1 Tax=Triticum urartu TaxID=4572 RepID=M7ZFA9_TRIUA|nr:hypothetical protein TRIUR3_14836 [Triticum urartu]